MLPSILDSLHQRTDEVGVVYSVTDRNSFFEVSDWLKEAKQHAPGKAIVVIDNKAD